MASGGESSLHPISNARRDARSSKLISDSEISFDDLAFLVTEDAATLNGVMGSNGYCTWTVTVQVSESLRVLTHSLLFGSLYVRSEESENYYSSDLMDFPKAKILDGHTILKGVNGLGALACLSVLRPRV